MSFYRVPAETVFLTQWSIREADKGSRHFLGWNMSEGSARVSTAILTFDPASRTGKTASGSFYQLVGRAGLDRDAEYTWSVAAKEWEFSSWKDVTAELVPDYDDTEPLRPLSPDSLDELSSGSIDDAKTERDRDDRNE